MEFDDAIVDLTVDRVWPSLGEIQGKRPSVESHRVVPRDDSRGIQVERRMMGLFNGD